MGKIAALVLFGLMAAGFFLSNRDSLVGAGAGDEPHYLIIADSIAHFGGPELTAAYRDGGLAHSLLPAEDLTISPQAHGNVGPLQAVAGDNGLYSLHNLGLPLLLAPALKLGGGMVAAKWLMLALSLSLPLLAWRAAETFIVPVWQRGAAGFALSAVTLFAIAATQLYPDLLAGILLGYVSLHIAARRLGEERTESPLLFLALMAVPWLHVRLILPMALCIAARFLLVRGRPLAWIIAPAISLLALALYNHHAFGAFAGPYVEGKAVEFSPTALMVLFGLQFDQFQGIFVHAPILLCALIGIGELARRDWRLSLFLVLLYGSLVAPNAVHPNWYGGGSFAGRFVLAGGIVLLVPAAYGLSRLFAAGPRLAYALCGLHLLVEAFLWYRYALKHVIIFNQSMDRALEDYATAWGSHQYGLPAFFRLDIAVRHWPNLAWTIAAILLLAAGWFWRFHGRRLLALAGIVILAGGAAGAMTRPAWWLVQPEAIAALDIGSREARISYSDPQDWQAVMELFGEFRAAGIKACVEQPLPGARFWAEQICSGTGPSVRFALVHNGGWALMKPEGVE